MPLAVIQVSIWLCVANGLEPRFPLEGDGTLARRRPSVHELDHSAATPGQGDPIRGSDLSTSHYSSSRHWRLPHSVEQPISCLRSPLISFLLHRCSIPMTAFPRSLVALWAKSLRRFWSVRLGRCSPATQKSKPPVPDPDACFGVLNPLFLNHSSGSFYFKTFDTPCLAF